MADFGASSNSLQGPQSSGGPVVDQKVNVPQQDFSQPMNALASMASKAGDAYLQGQIYKAKTGILSNIAQKVSTINDGVASGQITSQQAHAMSASSYNQALAAYPQFASEIQQLHGAFLATTQTGDTDKLIQQQRDRDAEITKQQDNMLMSEGYTSNPQGLDPATRQTYLAAVESTNATRKLVSDMQAKQTLASSQQSYQQSATDFSNKIEDRQRQMQLSAGLTSFANTQMDAYDAKVQDLKGQIAAGKLDYPTAMQQLQQFNGNFQLGVQAIAGFDKDFATPYKSLIDDKFKLAQQLLDPKSDAEQVQSKYNAAIARTKLLAITQNPEVRNMAAVSQIFPNNPMFAGVAAPKILETMTNLSNTPVLNGVPSGHTEQLVGSPMEGDVINGLKTAINQYAGKGYADNLKAGTEINNTVNNWLVQVGDMYSKKGVDASKLAPMANFFASPEYGKMMASGQIDQAANQAAKMTFQKYYEPAVVQTVGAQMGQVVPGTNDKLFNLVDANFDGLGIKFTPRAGLTPEQATATQTYINNSLQKYSQGMSTAVKMGSHMEGNTNYQQYWEKNRSILLPQLYPVAPGQVVNGAKWNGVGDWRDPKSWTKVGNGS